jgi:hypothetical protein
MNISSLFKRRSLLKAAAALGGLSALFGRAVVAHADGQSGDAGIEAPSDQARMADIPRSSTTKVTVERRGQIVLISSDPRSACSAWHFPILLRART